MFRLMCILAFSGIFVFVHIIIINRYGNIHITVTLTS